MFSRRIAEVESAAPPVGGCQELVVRIGGKLQKAINYLPLTGPAAAGERVVLNTTAVDLNLGSGGYHFVYLNLEHIESEAEGSGHMMKLRYTPGQIRILALEEEASSHHDEMAKAYSLSGMVVIAAELHSMLAPVVLTLKKEKPKARVVYLMTDGGALPAFFSRTVLALRQQGLLTAVITCGHAFGGDLEAVNVYSGLLAAKNVLQADAAVVCMGPGVAGTATPFGFSGIEMGENINRAGILNGHPVVVPRISFADKRSRHRGLSHHTLTALGQVALVEADVPLPLLPGRQQDTVMLQLNETCLFKRHKIRFIEGLSLEHLAQSPVQCSTMGRTLYEDEAFFLAAVAAGFHASSLL